MIEMVTAVFIARRSTINAGTDNVSRPYCDCGNLFGHTLAHAAGKLLSNPSKRDIMIGGHRVFLKNEQVI
jgi:hypothetical protein